MSFDTDVLATLRGRAGYANDNLLFYVTGGAAWLTADLSLDEKSEDAKFGPKDMSALGGEGLVMFFNEFNSIERFGNNPDPGDFVALDDAFVFRLGLNWRLMPFGARSAAAADGLYVAAALPNRRYHEGTTNRASSVEVTSPPRITIAVGSTIS
jgi:hypothetical protein